MVFPTFLGGPERTPKRAIIGENYGSGAIERCVWLRGSSDRIVHKSLLQVAAPGLIFDYYRVIYLKLIIIINFNSHVQQPSHDQGHR